VFWLPPVQDRSDDIRRQQRQAQQARDLGGVDLLGRRQLVDRAVAAGFHHLLQAYSDCLQSANYLEMVPCLHTPRWKPSLQTHNLLGIR